MVLDVDGTRRQGEYYFIVSNNGTNNDCGIEFTTE